MDSASSALSDATAEFGAYQIQMVSQNPKNGSAWVHIYLLGYSVDVEIENGHSY
jgi:hypothetical protein